MCRTLVTLTLLLTFAPPVLAQTRELTPFIGFQQGGAVTVRFDEGDIDDSAAFGAMLSFQRTPETMLDIVLLHQPTEVVTEDVFEPLTSDVAITYLHIGGRYLFQPGQRVDPYIALTAGGTRLAADGDSVVAFSFAAGGGVDIALSRALSLRLDGRFYNTLTDSASAIDCQFGGGGECSLFAEGSNFAQLSLTAGAVIRF
jgi:opacity protein-like surface antigen